MRALFALLAGPLVVACATLPSVDLADAGAGAADGGLDAAAPDASMPPRDGDGAAPDGAPVEPTGCQSPTVPTVDCAASCAKTSVSTSFTYANVEFFSPHGLALAGPWLYFAAQKKGASGRDGNDNGAIFRVPRRSLGSDLPEPMTIVQQRPRVLAAGFGYVYWASIDGPNSTVYRIPEGANGCANAGCAAMEKVGTVSGAATALAVPGPDQVFVTANTLSGFRSAAGGWQPLTPFVAAGNGRLAGQAGGPAFYASGTTVEMVRADGSVVSYAKGVAKFDDLDVAATCTDAVAFSTKSGLAFARSGGDLVPITCTGQCPATLTFDGALDAGFVYLAAPNGFGLFRIPRGGGVGVNLIAGDFWDVAVDNDAIYATELTRGAIVRIAK